MKDIFFLFFLPFIHYLAKKILKQAKFYEICTEGRKWCDKFTKLENVLLKEIMFARKGVIQFDGAKKDKIPNKDNKIKKKR